VMPPQDLQAAIEATLREAAARGAVRFLADCSSLAGGHSIADLYAMAQLLDGAAMPEGLREALVLPQLNAAAEDVQFWETICVNRGYTVRVFEERAAAEAWLAGPG
jgi:hypothetical protein